MDNNNYSGQLDPFHLQQSYNGMPTPITYPNANQNSSVRPPNMFFPPIDFSVPPPNFAQMNVSMRCYKTSQKFSMITCFFWHIDI